jgi:flagella basal body P-ring formation protein FlgA
MVLWSFLLLGSPAVGSIDDVLAPLDDALLDLAVRDAGSRVPSVASASSEPRPLVEPSVDEIDLLAELERLLSERIQPVGTLKLVPVSPMPRMQRRSELPEITLLAHPARISSSTALVRFRLEDQGVLLGDHAVTFRVQLLARVWAPSRRLVPGDVLQGVDLLEREVDLVREPRAVVADPALLERYEIARAVAPERSLTWSDITARALVRKGALVDVVASGGMLAVSMKGQATRSGALGEVVTIRNLESKREFPAEVVDENRVRVRF